MTIQYAVSARLVIEDAAGGRDVVCSGERRQVRDAIFLRGKKNWMFGEAERRGHERIFEMNFKFSFFRFRDLGSSGFPPGFGSFY
jgi:hypothetical protein